MWKQLKPIKSHVYVESPIPLTGMTLPDALDQTSERLPSKEAFVFASASGTSRVTYGQFRHDVIKMAAGLLRLGLQPGNRIGLWFESRYEWLVIQYASAYIKTTHVRFLVGYSEEYMENLIRKTKISALVFGSGNPEIMLGKMISKLTVKQCGSEVEVEGLPTLRYLISVGKTQIPGIFSIPDMLEMGEQSDIDQVMRIRNSVKSDDELSILFTSGSTGFPKAVVKSHKNIIENMNTEGAAMQDVIRGALCYMAYTPLVHASGDYASVMGVVRAAKTVIPDQSIDSAMLADIINTEGVSVMCLMFHQLFGLLQVQKSSGTSFPSLQLLYATGNVIPPEVLRKVKQCVSPYVSNFYGSTEAGGVTCNGNPDTSEKIGYPVSHHEVQIIDADGAVVPLNTSGELCVRSPFIMLRYEEDEEETKAVIDVDGWFHTGDICKMEEDGCLNIVGRKKDVIIKGSVNIYPFEVERVFLRHPKVKVCQVVSVPDEVLIEELCACVCLEEGQEAKEEDLMQFVRPLVPEYLLPRYLLFFDTFPTSPIGKMVRKELARKAKTIIFKS